MTNREEKMKETDDAKIDREISSSRRAWLGLSSFALLLKSCSDSKFSGITIEKKQAGAKPAEPVEIGSDSMPDSKVLEGGTEKTEPILDGQGPLEEAEQLKPCTSLSASKLDPTNIEQTDHVPRINFYGNRKSAMVVIDLAGYLFSSPDPIAQIVLVREDFSLIGMHGISSADVKDDSRARPIVIDHVSLKDSKRIFLVFLNKSGEQRKFAMGEDIEFVTRFRDKSVKDLSDFALLDKDYASHQGIPNIEEVKYDGFEQSDDPLHVFAKGRKLYTAQSTAKFIRAARLNGFIITDLMGDSLGNGGEFQDILEHPTFICYKEVEDVYFRTIVKVG
jgi:hypothetical protein